MPEQQPDGASGAAARVGRVLRATDGRLDRLVDVGLRWTRTHRAPWWLVDAFLRRGRRRRRRPRHLGCDHGRDLAVAARGRRTAAPPPLPGARVRPDRARVVRRVRGGRGLDRALHARGTHGPPVADAPRRTGAVRRVQRLRRTAADPRRDRRVRRLRAHLRPRAARRRAARADRARLTEQLDLARRAEDERRQAQRSRCPANVRCWPGRCTTWSRTRSPSSRCRPGRCRWPGVTSRARVRPDDPAALRRHAAGAARDGAGPPRVRRHRPRDRPATGARRPARLVAESGLETSTTVDLPDTLAQPLQRAVYRFVQEGLTNVRSTPRPRRAGVA